ncbi:MAG: hypothetical protein ABJH04_06820 [Cyclobacteriaceae bacterium]
MKNTFLLILAVQAFCLFGQDLEQVSNEILQDGIQMYRNERASWISTDYIPEKDKSLVNGYFTYFNGENFISIYFDPSNKNAVYKFTFQPMGEIDIEMLKTEQNIPLTKMELGILKVRKKAVGLSVMWYKQFGYTQIVNPNVIIHKTSPQYEVYVIPGAKIPDLIPIGGDLRMTFKSDGELDKIDAIHNNLIPFEAETSGKVYLSHEHKGRRLEKEYITSTDICTLLLYRDYVMEEKHTVVHRKFISEFYAKEVRLLIRPNTENFKN